MPVSQQFELSKAISLAIIDYLTHFFREDCKIKWPNDILINEKKAVVYSNRSAEILNSEIEQRRLDEEALISECTKIKYQLEKLNLKFKVKTGKGDRVFGSISTKEIAEVLQTPESTIKNRMKKAMTLLKRQLDNVDWEVLTYE